MGCTTVGSHVCVACNARLVAHRCFGPTLPSAMLFRYPTLKYLGAALWLLLTCLSCATVRHAEMSINGVAVADSALSTLIVPQFPDTYYVDQGVKYFLTMQSSVPISVRPNYSTKVIRWEWHPWLLLTGYGRRNLIDTDILLKLYPTTYDTIDCRFFPVQPFCRCHVVFNYSGKRIPIYEEFTFNNHGQITFIEAWSDFPSLLPMTPNDYWAEAPQVRRLSTRVPGLGNAHGLIDRKATWMRNAAQTDLELADLLQRLKRPFNWWVKEYFKQKEALKQAHHPPPGDRYPYR